MLKPAHTDFHEATQRMRAFFLSQGFVEVHPQSRLSILAACEDPTTIATFEYSGQKRPLPQTGQMWLEYELLKNPDVPGFFCVSTSYRQEPHPVAGRHETIFPMFEFELHGGMEELIACEHALLNYLGFEDVAEFARYSYDHLAAQYGVTELEHAHEEAIGEEISPVCFITDFPQYTSPFWNMKKHGTHANKVDVLLYGMETIGSAERSCSPEEMRTQFTTISNGEYAQILYDEFGKERVDAELEEFLSHDFFPRSGGGIGMTRMIRAMRLAGLLGHDSRERAGLRTENMKKSAK